MIFRPELAKLVKQGRKSQTRRRQTDSECRYVAGKSYAVQPGRGKESICRITVTEVRAEPLGAITFKDARREGFATTEEFFDYWRGLYGHVDRDLPVWVISFELGDRTDMPRLLTARPGGPSGDYTSNPHLAASGEPEAVGEADAERMSKLAHARDRERAKDPDLALRNKLMRALQEWEDETAGSAADRANGLTIARIRRDIRELDRKLRAA